MENVIIIENGHLIAFGIGVILGTIFTGVTIGLLIPTWVEGVFKKLRN